MPVLSLHNREQLDGPTADAFDNTLASITGLLEEQHDADGAHTDITADSIVVDEFVETPEIVASGIDPSLAVKTVSGVEIASLGELRSASSDRRLNAFPLDVQLLQRLNLGNRVDVALSGRTIGFTGTAGREAGFGVDEICYAITSTDGTNQLRQIYMPLGASNQPGSLLPRDLQTIVVWNATSSTILVGGFASEAFTDGIHGGPVTLGAGGSMLLVYDGSIVKGGQDGGWRIIGVNGLGWAAFTPTWVSASDPQPSLGTGGTVTAQYRADGKSVDFWLYADLGTGFSFGTGEHGFSLPIAAGFPTQRFPFSQTLLDGSTPYDGGGIYRIVSSTHCAQPRYTDVSTGQLSVVSSTAPFTWAAGDRIYLSGSYPI